MPITPTTLLGAKILVASGEAGTSNFLFNEFGGLLRPLNRCNRVDFLQRHENETMEKKEHLIAYEHFG